jgi:hypothetical protein
MGKKTWTRKLKELIQNNTQLNIKFHGPYGNVNLDHNIFILLAGGKLISFFFYLKKRYWCYSNDFYFTRIIL